MEVDGLARSKNRKNILYDWSTSMRCLPRRIDLKNATTRRLEPVRLDTLPHALRGSLANGKTLWELEATSNTIAT